MTSTPSPNDNAPAATTEQTATPAVGETSSLIGRVIAQRYTIEALLGEGGMGSVYLGEHQMMKKPVAVKVLHGELSQNQEIVARFQREAQAAAAINHPNICAATDFGRLDDGAFFLVMEYLEGRTLEAVLHAHEYIATERALDIVDQLLSVLEVAHAKGIVHRDLKPENLMLVQWDERDDVVKVMDFGIASMRPNEDDTEESVRLTRAGVAYGTPVYMSPEQVAGETSIDGRADLYAVGVILYEMLTGRPPYNGPSAAKVMTQHLTSPIPSLQEHAPSGRVFPADLDTIIKRLLAKEPEERFTSATDLREALASIDPHASPRRSITTTLNPVRLLQESETATEWLTAARQRLAGHPQHIQLAVVSIPIIAGLILVALIAAAVIGSIEPLPDDPQERVAVESKRITKDLAEQRDAFISETDGMRIVLETLAGGDADKAASMLADKKDALADTPHYHYYVGMAALERGQEKEALTGFARAFELEPLYAQEAKVVDTVLDAALSRDQEVRARAKKLLEDPHLLEATTSKLTEIAYSGEKRRTRRDAQQLLKTTRQWETLPEWRRHAIDLKNSSGCKAHARAIEQLAATGDERALEPLEAFADKPTSGCGLFKNKDCYGCIRDDLASAIATLKGEDTP